ncbi:hypothetical protein ACKKBG_A05980 [Auxenochlorella protothecoides x Auxenochlorella symbiontica]
MLPLHRSRPGTRPEWTVQPSSRPRRQRKPSSSLTTYLWTAGAIFALVTYFLYRTLSNADVKEATVELEKLYSRPSPEYCLRKTPPLVCGHGGDSSDAPPNSARAFQTALQDNVPCMEVDVARTKDGRLVVLHARELAALTGTSGKQVSEYSWPELSQLRWGDSDEGVVPVKPLLQLLQPSLQTIILDVKPTLDDNMQPTDLPVMTSAVAALLREVPCPNCIVWGKFDELALALRQAVPGQSVGYVVMNETAEVRSAGWDVPLRSPEAQVTALHYAMASTQLLDLLHAAAKRVIVWTANAPHMVRLALDAGADGVVTSYPKMVQKALMQRRDACLRLYGHAPVG